MKIMHIIGRSKHVQTHG